MRIRRRSVSSFVSPGPRVPMPPPSRDSAVARADEPRQQVLQLRQLHLQLAFARSRAPGEDVENQLRPIDDLAADRFLDLPQLRRRQLVVEDDDVDVRSPRTTRRASRSCRCRGTSTDRASAAPAARAAPTSAPGAPRPGRRARRASARPRDGARSGNQADERGALRATSNGCVTGSSTLPRLPHQSEWRPAPARTSRGAATRRHPRSSTAGRLASRPPSSSRSTQLRRVGGYVVGSASPARR